MMRVLGNVVFVCGVDLLKNIRRSGVWNKLKKFDLILKNKCEYEKNIICIF